MCVICILCVYVFIYVFLLLVNKYVYVSVKDEVLWTSPSKKYGRDRCVRNVNSINKKKRESLDREQINGGEVFNRSWSRLNSTAKIVGSARSTDIKH